MERRLLGNTRVLTTQVGLGTWGLAADSYGPVDRGRFSAVVERALELGIETFDVAPLWGDSEAVVGAALAGCRAETSLITRAGRRLDSGSLVSSFAPDDLERDCERSLSALKTDRVDVWLLHHPEPEALAAHDKALQSLRDALKRDGRIGAFGASVVSCQQAEACLDLGVDALAMPYNMLAHENVQVLQERLEKNQVSLIARSVLNHGVLSGRWGEARTFPSYDHRRDRWKPEALRARVQQASRLRYLLRGDIPSLAAAAVRFALANERVATVLLGPRNTSQLRELVGACKDGPPYLPEDDLCRIDEVLAQP